MKGVGLSDRLRSRSRHAGDVSYWSAIQDIVAPALHELRGEMQAMRSEIHGEIHAMRGEIRGEIGEIRGEIGELRGEMQAMRADVQRLDQKIDYMKGELVAEIRRLDARIDGVDRELRTAIDIRERLAALEARRS